MEDLSGDADGDPSRVDEFVGEVADGQCHQSKGYVWQGGGNSILLR